jgi:streptomycin 6-kinase
MSRPALLLDGSEIVLKLGPPNDELTSEIIALRHWNGRGAVRVLAAEPERGIVLLERLRPGHTMLKVFDGIEDDAQTTLIASQVMQQVWQPPPANASQLITVARWAHGMVDLRRRYGGGTGPFPPRLVEMAERLFADLQASAASPVVLHGDLHHENILQVDDGRWLAIDPKGVIGEPAYEIGAWLRNPPGLLHVADLAAFQARRIDLFSDVLGLDRQRLIGWGMAQAVLSAWWDVDEGSGEWMRDALIVAQTLADMVD